MLRYLTTEESIQEMKGRARRSAASLATALVAVGTVGCAGLATPRPSIEGVEVPGTWSEAGSAAVVGQDPSLDELAAWWRQLDDPILDELVERAVAGNIDLEIGVTRLEEARALRGLAKADLGPSISANASGARNEALGDAAPSTESYGASVDMAWEVDLFGANRQALAARQADLEAEVENLRALRALIAAETVVAYADLRVAEARLEVLDRSLESREESARLVEWREQAGLASTLEVNQVKSQLHQARAGRPVIEQSRVSARLRLDVLAGEAPGALDAVLAAPSAAPIPAPPSLIAVGIPADALRRRPDVRSAERSLEAAWARLGSAEAARYPRLQLTASLDSRSPTVDELFDLDSLFGNLIAGLAAPIFESGRIDQNIAVRDAQWRRAALSYEGTVLDALAEVERSLSAVDTARRRILSLREATAAAAEAAELADQRYAAGLVDVLSVLETEQTVFTSEEQLVIAKGDLMTAFGTLYRALGGGWETDTDTADPEGTTDA